MFCFETRTEAEILEIQNRGLLKEGDYNFTITSAEETLSQAGNAMLKIGISIADKDGCVRHLNDWLVAQERMIHKLKAFCECIGRPEYYETGEIDCRRLIGAKGICQISVKKGDAKQDGTGYYPDRNAVKGYIKSSRKPHAEAPSKITADADFFNDDIKF